MEHAEDENDDGEKGEKQEEEGLLCELEALRLQVRS